jgi:hypothetical protein
LTVLIVLTAAAILIAVGALLRARRVAKRLDQLVESYWELRYEYGQLRADVDKLQGKPDAPPASVPRAAEPTAFVPLSSIRRS